MGEQFAAQRAAGVRAGKVFGAEAPGVEQGHGQGVAQASCAVVLAVGARFSGQASRSTLQSSTRSACWARVDASRPVSAIRGAPRRLSRGRMAVSSPLSPLLEMASTTSAAVTMPRSPWLASAGVHEEGGGAGGRQGGGDLAARHGRSCPCPSPPGGQWWPARICTAWAKRSSTRAARPVSAAASISKVSRARRKACAVSKGRGVEGLTVMAGFYRPGPLAAVAGPFGRLAYSAGAVCSAPRPFAGRGRRAHL